ncbi:MAG: DNA/RNA nuclease SfsA [Pseudomonadales bacterium]|nr:DNA/RNA nuclease SfsA [Pseudomonadales bacterium]
MKFSPPFEEAVLIKRYKRFLADIQLPGGDVITIHCPNTGSMKNCAEPGSSVWYSTSDNPKRKYPNTWEIVSVGDERHLAGVNTHRANALITEAIEGGVIEELQGYDRITAEVKYGSENSRIDMLLERERERCYVEVKNVTLWMGGDLGVFPDSVTTRGTKHLRELILQKEQGDRSVLVFCVQHSGIKEVRPADDIDPEYGRVLREAAERGVEIIAYAARMSREEIKVTEKIPVYW